MAGSTARSRVPQATFTEGSPSTSTAMPASTGNTSAPVTRAMQHTLEVPSSILFATLAVMELSVWVTPWATTPLSAQKAATHFL